MGALGSYLLEGLGQAVAPVQTTQGLHVAPDGSLVDATGNPTTPYQKPGFFRSLVNSSGASYANEANAQAQLQGVEAQRQEAIQRGILGGRVDSIPSSQWPTIQDFVVPQDGSMGPTNPAISIPKARAEYISELQSPELSPSHRLPEMAAAGGINTGTVPLTGANNALVGNRDSRYNLGMADTKLGTLPTAQQTYQFDTTAANAIANKGAQLATNDLGNVPNYKTSQNLGASNDAAGQGNMQTRLQQEKEQLPWIGRGGLANAETQANIAEQGKKLLPNTLSTMANDSTLQNIQSQWGPIMSPIGTHIHDGVAERGINPIGMNAELAKYQSIINNPNAFSAGGSNGGAAVSLSSGLSGTAQPMLRSSLAQLGNGGEQRPPPSSGTNDDDDNNKKKTVIPSLGSKFIGNLSQPMSPGNIPFNGSSDIKQNIKGLQSEIDNMKGKYVTGSKMWTNTIGWRLKKIQELQQQADQIDAIRSNQ